MSLKSCCSDLQVSLDDRHIDDTSKVNSRLLVSREDTSAFLQPSDKPFDNVSLTVLFFIEVDQASTSIFVFFRGNDRDDSHFDQHLVDPPSAITFVTGDSDRPRNHLAIAASYLFICAVEKVNERTIFVALSRRYFKVKRESVSIAGEMDFRGKTAARSPKSMILGFFRVTFFPPPAAHRAARTIVPSTHQSSLSI